MITGENISTKRIQSSTKINASEKLLIWIQILALAAFIFINIGLVFAYGVCCGDDGYYAHIAKNLADGLGYTSSLPLGQTHFSLTLFDPYSGGGPTIILPAALMIKLVGNTYWAPGVTAVLLWTILLICIGICINKIVKDKTWLAIGTFAYFFFSYIFMAYHFEQWYALLGEVPSALLIILAVLVYFVQNSRTNLILTGLLFSLAFESKFLSIIPFAIFMVCVVIYHLIQNGWKINSSIKPTFQNIVYIAIGFLVPIFLFEFWKLIALHPSGYYQWWVKYLGYVSEFGADVNLNLGARISERINIASSRFGIFIPLIFFLFAVIGYALRKNNKLISIYLVLIAMIAVNTVYWLIFSLGWARYYLIPLIMIIFALVFPFFDSNIKPWQKGIYIVVLLGLTIYNLKSINISYPMNNVQLFRPSANTQAQLEVESKLSRILDERPFYTQGWVNAVDLEYLMDTHLNFSTIYDPALDFSKPIIVVVNNRLLFGEYPNLTNLLSKCKTEQYAVYTYAECPPLNSP